jgi:hypothetical protein
MMRARRVLGAAIVALTFAGCGQAAWREADANLNAAAGAARADGFAPMAGPHNTFGDFTAAGETAWRTHLEAHQAYVLVAACTAGCAALDFTVYEPHGAALGTDTSAAPTPRLAFTAPEEGDYRVVFRFGRCGAARCRWVAQAYRRGGDSR